MTMYHNPTVPTSFMHTAPVTAPSPLHAAQLIPSPFSAFAAVSSPLRQQQPSQFHQQPSFLQLQQQQFNFAQLQQQQQHYQIPYQQPTTTGRQGMKRKSPSLQPQHPHPQTQQPQPQQPQQPYRSLDDLDYAPLQKRHRPLPCQALVLYVPPTDVLLSGGCPNRLEEEEDMSM
eukprot:TRINITY_DN4497_c0_g1_i1.p1 TRINITY_DN4497_c0_g1~~TRINITY_DN4497_c0_g1_i1.p1  ORF type:complete len:173 (-),score=60.90 TRINITY_DN4497_c0_g1_i1:54-572(-)